MNVFTRALRDASPHVRVPWLGLSRLVQPVVGNLVLVCGGPGAGKSMFTLAWALMMAPSPVRFINLDTDDRTQAERIVEAVGSTEAIDDYMLVMNRPLRPREVGAVVQADTDYWGEAPGLVVVDDTEKLVHSSREFGDWVGSYVDLHRAARLGGTAVLAVHHMRAGESRDFRRPPNISDLQYAPDYEPELILGVWRPTDTLMRVSVLKNRRGESDPEGRLYASLRVDMARCRIDDLVDERRRRTEDGARELVGV